MGMIINTYEKYAHDAVLCSFVVVEVVIVILLWILRGRYKMHAASQTTFSSAFSLMKMFEFQLKCQ